MSNATAPAASTALFSVSVHTNDGAYYVTPAPSLAEAVLEGMMDAQAKYGQIAWEDLSSNYAKGTVVEGPMSARIRVVVLDSNASTEVEDAVLNFFDE